MKQRSSAPPQVRAPWMTPGAPRIQKPSWLTLAATAAPVVEIPVVSPIEIGPHGPSPSSAPPRSFRKPSMPPPSSPSSRRHPPAQIQTTREVELESEVHELHAELQRIIEESSSMKARVMEESEPAIVALAIAIAKRVVGREVQADPQLLQAWIREARGMLPNGELFVAPDVEEPPPEAMRDPSLAIGTAEVRDGSSVIVVGADARMAAMADALGVDP